MERLSTGSPISRRIVSAFLDFIDRVEPAPGIDLEGLDVVKECLEEIFELEKYPGEKNTHSQLLIDLFSHGENLKEPAMNLERESRHINASNGTSKSNAVDHFGPEISRNRECFEREENPIVEGISKDELFGQFYAGLDRINFFAAMPGGDEDHVQLTKATNFFEDAILEMEKSGTLINRMNLAETFKSRGNKAMHSKSYVDAIDLYTCAIALCGSAIYYCNRAAAYTQVCKYNEAIEDCKKSIEIDPNYAKAYSRQGLVYYALGKYKEAVLFFLKALQLDPNNESVQDNIRVAQQKWREEQAQAEEHSQNGSSNRQQQNSQSGGSRSQPSGFQIPFDISNFASVFGNMGSGVPTGHDGQDRSAGPAGPNNHNRGMPSMNIDLSQILNGFAMGGFSQHGTQPEARVDGGVTMNFQNLPEDLSGILGSVTEMFMPHTTQRDSNTSN